jgi:hypothetical protein
MKIQLKFLLPALFITSVLTITPSAATAQLVPDFRVNEDPTNEFQGQGSMGCDTSGNFVVTWRDRRGLRPKIIILILLISFLASEFVHALITFILTTFK